MQSYCLIVSNNPAGPISRLPGSTGIPSASGRVSGRLSGYSAENRGREVHLEPNHKFVLECTGTPPPGRVASARLLVMLLVVAALEGRVRAGLAGRLPDIYEALVRALMFALLIAALLYLASRLLDHRRMSDYGFHFSRKWWTDLGFGLVLGALLVFGVLAVEFAMGWVSVIGSFAPSPASPL